MTEATVNRVLLGVRGLSTPEAISKVITALKAIRGVEEVTNPHPDQILVGYDPGAATVMELIRSLRAEGFLAGML